MQIKNTEERYGIMAITFHWIIAFLIIGMLAVGLYMVGLPIGTQKLKLFGLHKAFGLFILMLACLRIGWRLANRVPNLPNEMPRWQIIAARSVHWAFYVFMFALPITGWLMSSAAGFPVSFFGLFTFPNLIAPNKELMEIFETIHHWLAYALIAAICLHVGAALQHHFINKDNVLTGMLP